MYKFKYFNTCDELIEWINGHDVVIVSINTQASGVYAVYSNWYLIYRDKY